MIFYCNKDIKLVTTEARRNYLGSYIYIYIKINKPVYLGLSIVEKSKTVMYEF